MENSLTKFIQSNGYNIKATTAIKATIEELITEAEESSDPVVAGPVVVVVGATQEFDTFSADPPNGTTS